MIARTAGIIKLDHYAIASDNGRGILFAPAYSHHLRVGEIGIESRAGTAAAGGAGHAAALQIILRIAGDDAVKGHQFQIILVCSDPEMGNAPHGPFNQVTG